MDENESAVVLERVGKRYGDVVALDGLSLSVGRGELFGFLGANGAGKTTTIKLLTGQRVPDEGSVSVLGRDPSVDPVETRRHLGILPEREDPPSFVTPREYFGFVGRVRDIDSEMLAARVDGWTRRFAFREQLDTLCTDLSRGQRQKVMIAASFLHEPDLVFIDEPLANLDPIMQERLKEFLVAYTREENTVFLSTHHIDVAEEICTRVGVLRDGHLVEDRRLGDSAAGDDALLDVFLDEVDAP
ncbi:ABC transporter ATP-binding protein [Halomarina oriensis]|uniref:ATP-binding cassette domain-containing protein n=1 Tax=Halomarina oriensis TaxID=671145 RepID=A0A6B0GRB9_9EURY|nr:ABC transporter ATP-binding protein [Halomarina oriensis]MWG36149.1 ATP-binding cassette domain-containing protein [Halomarina oriensis]